MRGQTEIMWGETINVIEVNSELNEWPTVDFDDVVLINPSEKMPKGTQAKKVTMDKIQAFTKRIKGYEVEGYSGGTKFRNGDTLLARITPCLENGKTAFVDFLDNDEVAFGSTEYIVIRERKGITDKQFLYYLAISPDFRDMAIQGMTGSSGRQRVETDVVRNHQIDLPSLPEQRSIATILSSLDDKIDLLHRQNVVLESLAETLFRQWFLEEAKEEWEEKELGEVTTILIGRTPPRKETQWFSRNPEDIKWISIKDMGQDGAYIFSTSEFLTEEAVVRFKVPVIPNDTVVLSFKMTVGRVAITTEPMLSNEAIAHFKFSKHTPFTKEYLYLFLKTYKYDTLGSTSSIVTSINSAMIKEMKIVIPNEERMIEFQHATESWFNKIRHNQTQVQTLSTLRNTLLPKLMSGEVRVAY